MIAGSVVVTGDARLPFTTRARILVDTAAALNPKDEKSFFKMKGAAHIGRAFELLTGIGRPVMATNTFDLLTSEKNRKPHWKNRRLLPRKTLFGDHI